MDNFYYNDSQFTGVTLRNKVVQECTFCTGMSVLSPENKKDIEGWKLSELTPHHTFTLHSTRTVFDSADWQYFIQRLFSILNQNKACNLRYNVQFQKISIPPPRRELEIPGGWGGQRPRKFQRGGGVGGKIHFQMVGNRSTHFVRQKAPLTHYCRDVLKF